MTDLNVRARITKLLEDTRRKMLASGGQASFIKQSKNLQNKKEILIQRISSKLKKSPL